MRKRGGNGEYELGVLGRVLREKGSRAGIKFQVPKPESERADGLVIVVVSFPLSALAWGLRSVHTDILFVDCTAQPFHHTSNEGEHLFSCS